MWFGPFDYAHEYDNRDTVGSIEINDTYVTRRKPLWLVLLKLLGMALMVAVGVGLAWPSLSRVLPPVQAAAVIAGGILIYSGLAFFVRPEPNTDNLGYCGGMQDNPWKLSDDYNRGLLDLHMALGPGRYFAETLLDLCVSLGFACGEEVLGEDAVTEQPAEPMQIEIVTLKASRFEE